MKTTGNRAGGNHGGGIPRRTNCMDLIPHLCNSRWNSKPCPQPHLVCKEIRKSLKITMSSFRIEDNVLLERDDLNGSSSGCTHWRAVCTRVRPKTSLGRTIGCGGLSAWPSHADTFHRLCLHPMRTGSSPCVSSQTSQGRASCRTRWK